MTDAKIAEPPAELDLLLVDDEADFLEPSYRYFEKRGYHVAAAADATQALAVQAERHLRRGGD